jgi:sugar phosphate permease
VKKLLVVLASIFFGVSAVFTAVTFTLDMIAIQRHEFDYPLTVILPTLFTFALTAGALLLLVAAVKHNKGNRAVRSAVVGVSFLAVAALLLVVAPAVNQASA